MPAAANRDPPPPQGAALRAAKLAVRRLVLAARDRLAADYRMRASDAIATGIGALPSFDAAQVVLLTLSFRSEWDTLPVVRAALARGKRVAVPRVDPDARMLALFALTDPDRDLAPGYQGIPEPRAHCASVPTATIEWVLVPGVAFDAAGRRLGYGGGYYDRLLPIVAPAAARVAGAFEVQVVERVPSAPHDLTVDTIVTESQTLHAPRRP